MRSQQCGLRQALLGAGAGRDEPGGLAIADGDGAGLVEDERLHVAGSLDGLSRRGEHVEPYHPVDPGNPDRGQQRADGRRNQRDHECYQVCDVDLRVEVGRHRGHRGHHDHKDQGQDREQDGECDFVGRLLSSCTFHQMDHTVEEALAGICGHANEQPIGDDGRSGCHRREHVGAGLPQHWRRFTGDRRFIDERDPFDYLAVGGNDVGLLDPDHVPLAQCCRGHVCR